MGRPFRFWGFRSSNEILENSLGSLERGVMDLVWARGDVSVRDARTHFGSDVAYTTLMTTMDRLFKKGLLTRRKVGRAFVYAAAASRADVEGAVAAELVHSLLQRDGEPLPVLSSLVDAVSDRDRALLEELERLIRQKRRALDRERTVVIYVLYGATLAFTWFLTLNLVLSLIVAGVSRRVAAAIATSAPAWRARALLTMRLLPAVVSIAFVAGVFLPSFWTLEPRDFDEAFGVTTTSFALIACLVLAAALWRGVSALRESAGRSRAWLTHAQPMALDGAPAPVYCLDAAVPAMTLVGVFRSKLLVTQPLIDALTPEELRAAIAHEVGHLGSWDNLKRLVMRATPDALSLLSASRRLERDWAMAAEHAADAAAAHDSGTGLALASALIKVARLTPAKPAFAPLASPLVGGEGIVSRVERLMDRRPPRRPSIVVRTLCWTAATIVLFAAIPGYAPLLQSVHRVSEVLVHTLP